MYDVLTLTLNPVIDVFYRPETAGSGSALSGFSAEAAGKGINVSKALGLFGIESKAVVCVGENDRKDYENLLLGNAFKYCIVETPGESRKSLTVFDAEKGEIRSFSDNFRISHEAFAKCFDEVIFDSDEQSIVSISGKLPRGCGMSFFAKRCEEIKGRLILDSRSFCRIGLALIHPWLIKPNKEEAAYLLDRDASSLDGISAAKELFESGCAEHVVVSLGEDGLVYYGKDGSLSVSVKDKSYISTVGAGDSVIAGIIAGQRLGMNVKSSVILGAAFGHGACKSAGTGLKSADDAVSSLKELIIDD